MSDQTHCDAYVLCSTPRSGTTLTCDLLRQTGVAGAPDSFFRQKSLADWCQSWGIADPPQPEDETFSHAYFQAMKSAGRQGTDRFGLRLMGPDLTYACNWLARMHPSARTDRARFDAAFGVTRYIHLTRTDKLAEAISYLRAEQTGLWHSAPDGGDIERIPPTEPDGFDAARITERMTMLRTYDELWPRWFDAQGIVPLRVTYEALSADPLTVLRKILLYIGKDPDCANHVTPGTRKLADETSVAWIAEYRRRHSA
ncbi:Stf0 family sulfotransferase [Sulfitobacter sp. JB4-11]|uniref:Stf0 family sulfotransferase n=1 Tax=Sulfitobacter rhodophyticola TaxID=3238304 RepID=UPI003519934F